MKPLLHDLPRRPRLGNTRRDNVLRGLLFISPWLVGLAMFKLAPILASLVLSLTDFKLLTPKETQFIGLENYAQAFGDGNAWTALLHFFYTWNETRLASVYLNSDPKLMPVSFGVQVYQSRVPIQNVIQASTLVVLVVPLVLLFVAQRYFMQGLVITGAEGK